VVTRLNVGASVEVDLEKSTTAFYKITTAGGIEGYCMKEFIAIV
jgi:hypothetical protein